MLLLIKNPFKFMLNFNIFKVNYKIFIWFKDILLDVLMLLILNFIK